MCIAAIELELPSEGNVVIMKQSMCVLCAIGFLSESADFVAAKAGTIETVTVTAQYRSLQKNGNKVGGEKSKPKKVATKGGIVDHVEVLTGGASAVKTSPKRTNIQQ